MRGTILVALFAIKLLMLAAFMLASIRCCAIASLQPVLADGQRFLSTYFVRFGRAPVWNSIRPDELQLPGSAISASATTGAGMDAATR